MKQQEKVSRFEESDLWPVLQKLPMQLRVRIALPRMALSIVQKLTVGSVVESTLAASQELPLLADNVALSWCEITVVDGSLAARLTRLG